MKDRDEPDCADFTEIGSNQFNLPAQIEAVEIEA
jgi:hypothetical protein